MLTSATLEKKKKKRINTKVEIFNYLFNYLSCFAVRTRFNGREK